MRDKSAESLRGLDLGYVLVSTLTDLPEQQRWGLLRIFQKESGDVNKSNLLNC